MILIADSGSTKTHWRLVDKNKKIKQYSTQGISPYFLTQDEIIHLIKNELTAHFNSNEVEQVFYYGTGCSAPKQIEIVAGALRNNFSNAKVEVNHDLLAAARAVCGKNKGMAAILGTGSNTCLFDGNTITHNVFSAGFILGDEGSGAHIGKTFIQHFIRNELPETVAQKFRAAYNLTPNDIIEKVYKQATPNRFLASFALFVHQQLNDKYVYEMVCDSFDQFFKTTICKYPDYKNYSLGLVGSVAFNFSNVLKQVAQQHGVQISVILESPIAALTTFHVDIE